MVLIIILGDELFPKGEMNSGFGRVEVGIEVCEKNLKWISLL
jgi:hypothetical protein